MNTMHGIIHDLANEETTIGGCKSLLLCMT